jgi:putative ABC transport system permease protein
MDFAGEEGAERLRGSYASPNFFDVLGVRATIGRTFSESDTASGAADVVVVSDGLWRRQFGADRAVVGRSIEITLGRRDRSVRRFTVIGVLPPSFRFTYPKDTELWTLRNWREVYAGPKGAGRFTVIARLRDGVSVAQAQAEMAVVNDGMERDDRSLSPSRSIVFEPVQEYAFGQLRPAMLLLISVTVFLLAVACVNVANLLLARSTG